MRITQEQIEPITARRYMVENWQKYEVADTRDEFIALLNVLQACGECLETMYETYQNGDQTFADVWCWEWSDPTDVVRSLFEHCTFLKGNELADYILDLRDNYDSNAEWSADIRKIADDEDPDMQIMRTEDGYVVRVWY